MRKTIIAKNLKKTLLEDGAFSRALFEFDLEDRIAAYLESKREDGDKYLFVIAEKSNAIAMMLIDENDEVCIEKARAEDRYGEVFVDTQRSFEIYREWLKMARPTPGPNGLRRPLWLNRPLRPRRRGFIFNLALTKTDIFVHLYSVIKKRLDQCPIVW